MLTTAVFAAHLLTGSPAIEPQRMVRDLRILTSEAYGGRMTLSPSMRKAADYIAGELRAAGLQPAGPNGSYFHEFDVTINRVPTARNFLTVDGKAFELGRDFVPCNGSTDMRLVRGQTAYVGFAAESDVKDMDLTGKVAVALRGTSDGKTDSMNQKAARVAARGAVGILFVGPEQALGPQLAPLAGGFSIARGGIPGMSVHGDLAPALIGLSLTEARRRTSLNQPKSVEVRFVTESVPQTGRALNVLAKLPGTDSKTSEILVVGAHYDHLGFGETSSRTGHNALHAGADDNASGTVAVIELARAFARSKALRRTVHFQLYSGEEIGLLGSRAWAIENERTLPQIQAMVNLDMIGRLREQGVTVYGTGTAAEMNAILDEAKPGDLKVVRQPASPSNSDHASFSTRGVPVLFFNTGLHDEYHTEKDLFPTINTAGMAQVTDYVYRTLVALDSKPKLAFTGTRQGAGASGDPNRPRRVRFGVQPDMNEVSGKGLVVNGVTADTPAAKAGIKIGDRILSIGGKPVNSVQDLQQILVEAKPGVALEVVLIRGDKELKLMVTMEAPIGG